MRFAGRHAESPGAKCFVAPHFSRGKYESLEMSIGNWYPLPPSYCVSGGALERANFQSVVKAQPALGWSGPTVRSC